jgi:AraC-like DNA-binding protein
MEADALQAIGWANLVAGNLDEAERAITEAIQIATTLKAKPLLVTLHYDLSQALERRGNINGALTHYREYARLWGLAHLELNAAPSTHSKRRLEPFYLKRAEDFIRAALPQSPTAAEIAEYAGASIRAVQTAFKEYRGITPHAASLAMRYEAAREALLAENSAPTIGQVCSEFGFDDPSRFAREFKKRFGVLPSSLRSPGVRD